MGFIRGEISPPAVQSGVFSEAAISAFTVITSFLLFLVRKRRLPRSELAQQRAQQLIPGGVNSPVRSFRAVGGTPPVIHQGQGSRVTDIDGHTYIDYVLSYGPAILGHAAPQVVEAVQHAASHGFTYGAPTLGETELAGLLCEAYNLDLVRLCSSGTEATMTALRVMRGFTGLQKFIKIRGGYHGHADPFLSATGSAAATLEFDASTGVAPQVTAHTLLVDFNDFEGVRQVFAQYPGEIAGIIVEPVQGNAGLILPQPGYLEFLRQITWENQALLVFDEVMTGSRVRYGGASAYYQIQPDLICLGKIIGGGLPIGAFGGRRDLMDCLTPTGNVYHAGTLNGNPLAVAAGVTTLSTLKSLPPKAYDTLEALGSRLVQGLRAAAQEFGFPVQVSHIGGMWGLFFADQPVQNFNQALNSSVETYTEFFHQMLSRGIYLPPSAFEANFLSFAHSKKDVDATIEAARQSFAAMAETF